MRKRFTGLIVSLLMVISIILTGCTQDSDTVKIGWIGSLTGDQAVWGTCELNAVKMVVEEINNSGGILGKKVEVVGYDTRGDAMEAVNAVKRLTSQDRVIAIIGPNSSGQAISISGVLEEMKVASIATVATNPKVTVVDGNVKPYNFRVCFIDPYQGAVAAGYAAEVLGFTRAAILYDVTDDYSQGLTEFFEKSFVEKGGQIVAKEGFKFGDVDFRPQLSKIKDANPEVIFMPYFYKEVALSANQARELGIDAVLMGGDGWPSDQLLEMAKDSIDGSYVVNHLDFDDPEVQDFKTAYEEKYNRPIEINGFLAHDAVRLLEAAVIKANSLDPSQIASALSTTSIKGITGQINISKDTHNPEGKEAAIIKIENGGYKFQQKYGVK
ncbi:amino acid/amide ABC transporter substrate-binding protein, HAAT family (TC 3.A.1.4.-) [Alkalithermobacter thermoalcaliphilus JW-YL-7 = DSM 7308]|uniref:Amino acid/amide ABC transporter substrate-binding protein, HAAT family (TC 3.A.1.4.-) n=1 Tax=Alkalithermobacter thermoalcaliphilus JW-YL-7 = DSM 7308 TaxID=1121328 RepID=A0A150FPL6_CLOPD|nr:extracellular ligand-binding receptor [[Clostridium] paradoxum JW-YL-7 = DSM 7308]SHK91465.1 amino acid/amide ABC transporter substrate-binding protein, HAAT family (TC 3.A.1.4.-) [[Clostridium] paradoxum JW-YL-7 = DSM 7308]